MVLQVQPESVQWIVRILIRSWLISASATVVRVISKPLAAPTDLPA